MIMPWDREDCGCLTEDVRFCKLSLCSKDKKHGVHRLIELGGAPKSKRQDVLGRNTYESRMREEKCVYCGSEEHDSLACEEYWVIPTHPPRED